MHSRYSETWRSDRHHKRANIPPSYYRLGLGFRRRGNRIRMERERDKENEEKRPVFMLGEIGSRSEEQVLL